MKTEAKMRSLGWVPVRGYPGCYVPARKREFLPVSQERIKQLVTEHTDDQEIHKMFEVNDDD